ncbi:MAG: rhodanese-like domain-containing protein [Gammaproteobacteria bacterium]|nr:rhodanese-like domain-containing protein [Gammaproteobacteria bacterium]
MDYIDFIIKNWYLFAALAIILAMLFGGTIMQVAHGVQGVNCSHAVQLMNHQDAIVVDVSEPNEFQIGHVPGAKNLPIGSLENRLTDLEKYKAKPIIVSCRSGNRSKKGALMLSKHGFKPVYEMSGGMVAWQRDNLPVEK